MGTSEDQIAGSHYQKSQPRLFEPYILIPRIEHSRRASSCQLVVAGWKRRSKWIPRRGLPFKTKLRRRTGFCGIRVGEATRPGPPENILDWESSSEEEVGPHQPGPQAGILARIRKRQSRAKKVGHMVTLKPQFFKGLKAATPNATTHTSSAVFVQADGVDLCHRLYPKTLTALLNSQPRKLPKWMAKRWRPFQCLSAACKCLENP